MIKSIIDILAGVARYLSELAMRLLGRLWDWFLSLNIFEKAVAVNMVAAFFAVVLPVAKYFIFETYFYINNHLAHYLIGIVLIMLITQRFPGKVPFIIRVVINAYYLFWIIYMHLTGDLSKAPYKITFGYYLNILVPLIFISASALSYRFYDNG